MMAEQEFDWLHTLVNIADTAFEAFDELEAHEPKCLLCNVGKQGACTRWRALDDQFRSAMEEYQVKRKQEATS